MEQFAGGSPAVGHHATLVHACLERLLRRSMTEILAGRLRRLDATLVYEALAQNLLGLIAAEIWSASLIHARLEGLPGPLMALELARRLWWHMPALFLEAQPERLQRFRLACVFVAARRDAILEELISRLMAQHLAGRLRRTGFHARMQESLNLRRALLARPTGRHAIVEDLVCFGEAGLLALRRTAV
jgi:hypothetical protein